MAKASGLRARNRAALEAEILGAAAQALADVGAAGLSLRALARELGMVPSALYRYYASRDDLLTQLIVRTFDSLGDAVDTALESAPGGPRERFATIATATRAWALERPHEFALLYGTPVPRYHAPADVTNPSGTRVQGRLLEVLAVLQPTLSEQHATGALGAAAAGVTPLLEEPTVAPFGLAPVLLVRGLMAWSLVLGTVTAEVFEQFGPDGFGDADAHFAAVVEAAWGLVADPA